MEDEIKDCPFCDRKPEARLVHKNSAEGEIWYRCPNQHTEWMSLEIWNRRTNQLVAQKSVEEIATVIFKTTIYQDTLQGYKIIHPCEKSRIALAQAVHRLVYGGK